MRPDPLPGPLPVPDRTLLGRVVPASRMLKAGEDLATRTTIGRGIQIALPTVQLVQPPLQLGHRVATVRLSPRLAHSLVTLDHAVVLGPSWRVEQQSHAQARQPARQVGGQIALRTPGHPVVESQSLGEASAGEPPPQGRLGVPGGDLTPGRSGEKSPSPGQRHWPRRRPGANRPGGRRAGGSVPRRRPATSGAAWWPGSPRRGAAWGVGPVPARRCGTIGGAYSGRVGEPWAVVHPARPGSGPPPRWDALAAAPGRPRGPEARRHARAAGTRDSRATRPRARDHGIVFGGVARCEETGRRRRRGWRSSPPAGLVGGSSAARGSARALASLGPRVPESERVEILPLDHVDSLAAKPHERTRAAKPTRR
jgi:hypothetical protein